MAETFGELGLRQDLVAILEDRGFARPSPLQRGAIPVLRRGGNAVLHAAPGAGVTAAYGLALLDLLATPVEHDAGDGAAAAEEDAPPAAAADGAAGGPGALVLVAGAAGAARAADFLARFGRRLDLRVRLLRPDAPADDAAIIVATPDAALAAVHGSRIKLEALRSLVIEDAAVLLETAGDAVEALASAAGRAAQRVVVTGSVNPAVEDFVERHARRALWIPARPADAPPQRAPRDDAPERRRLRYAVLPDSRKLEAVGTVVGGAAAGARVYCRTEARATDVAAALEVRGAAGVRTDGATVLVEGAAEGDDLAVSYDPPFDAQTLGERHARGGLVLVEPRHLPHLQRMAEEAGFLLTVEPQVDRPPEGAGLGGYRQRLRQAVREEDLAAQILVLEPLLDEFSAVEIAAAASALLRRRGADAAGAALAAPRLSTAAPPPQSWVRLFIGVGKKDNVRPGDLVGAFTGEAGVSGEDIGKVEIRETFSVVEVTAGAADRVIRALNGSTLKGRSLRVDYDRRPPVTGGAKRRPPAGPPRRGGAR
jgi:ATP-dependent RNA helicase DeaD